MSYILEYKESTSSSWSGGVGGTQPSDYFTGTSTTVSGLTNGTSYDFRVSALNLHGSSATTDPTVVATTDTVPSAPNPPTTTNSDTRVTINWDAPSENGSPIQNYTILFKNGAGA